MQFEIKSTQQCNVQKIKFSQFESIIRVIQNFKAPLLVNRDLGFNLSTNWKTWKFIATKIMALVHSHNKLYIYIYVCTF